MLVYYDKGAGGITKTVDVLDIPDTKKEKTKSARVVGRTREWCNKLAWISKQKPSTKICNNLCTEHPRNDSGRTCHC